MYLFSTRHEEWFPFVIRLRVILIDSIMTAFLDVKAWIHLNFLGETYRYPHILSNVYEGTWTARVEDILGIKQLQPLEESGTLIIMKLFVFSVLFQ